MVKKISSSKQTDESFFYLSITLFIETRNEQNL